ncbi:MAG TPA: outer membrane beta-barrel protein [Gammaproteobacteria bacterium]|nr:outer membrane beta-barrel protein [Gammaproteobacteria bacterium]
MKIIVFSVALALASLLAAPLAPASVLDAPLARGAANDDVGSFLTVKIGKTAWSLNDQYSDNQKATTYAMKLGYRWRVTDASAIGFDFGYIDFGTIDDEAGGAFATVGGSAFTAGLNYQFTFGDAWYVEGRGGYMKLTLDSNVSLPGISVEIGPISTGLNFGFNYNSEGFEGLYLGVGAGRWLTSDIGLSINYDYHRVDDVYGDSLNLATFTIAAEFVF